MIIDLGTGTRIFSIKCEEREEQIQLTISLRFRRICIWSTAVACPCLLWGLPRTFVARGWTRSPICVTDIQTTKEGLSIGNILILKGRYIHKACVGCSGQICIYSISPNWRIFTRQICPNEKNVRKAEGAKKGAFRLFTLNQPITRQSVLEGAPFDQHAKDNKKRGSCSRGRRLTR